MGNKNRTPFIQQASGDWVLLLPQGMHIEWGQRFDAEFGYRVFIKFVDSDVANVLPAVTAKIWAKKFMKDEMRADILAVCRALIEMAGVVEKLNTAWAAAGAPALPLDQIGTPANA